MISVYAYHKMATVTNWPPHVHYGIILWAYLSQTHRPTALHCMHYGITLWAYLSEPLIKDSTACSKSRDHTLTLHTCCGEVYGNIAREENGWLSSDKFITLLTFELSSFRENCFLVYCISRAVATDTSRWTPKTARRQNRENNTKDKVWVHPAPMCNISGCYCMGLCDIS